MSGITRVDVRDLMIVFHLVTGEVTSVGKLRTRSTLGISARNVSRGKGDGRDW